MKITDVTTSHCNYVTIDNEEYIRFGPNAWYKFMGESLEPVFSYELAVETAYQEYIRTSGNRSG